MAAGLAPTPRSLKRRGASSTATMAVAAAVMIRDDDDEDDEDHDTMHTINSVPKTWF